MDRERGEKPGAAFERLAGAVQHRLDPGADVRWNETISGRQIDVVVRGRIGSVEVLVIVECRDYASALGIEHIDRLDSVKRDVGANKAILVTRTGFTEDALQKAATVGIDTCVLRPSNDGDHPGPYKPLKSMHLTVQAMSTVIDDLEVELADGRRFPCSQFYRLEDDDGKSEFLDRIVKGWLQEHRKDYQEGTPLNLELLTPAKLLRDEEQPMVAKLHCVARTVPAFKVESIWEAPAEWTFVQLKPKGETDEQHFFEFPDLQALADALRVR
ncbi:MAG: hypothetical protein AMXMBFR56_55460 [Polyangiaceae bacterium]